MDDPRNTVRLPRPGRKNRRRRQIAALVPVERRLELMPNIEKVALSQLCVWCGNDMQEPRPICRFCRCCQYCGLKPNSSHVCDMCGNHHPDPPQRVKRRLAVHSGVAIDRTLNGPTESVRRVGPMKRNKKPTISF